VTPNTIFWSGGLSIHCRTEKTDKSWRLSVDKAPVFWKTNLFNYFSAMLYGQVVKNHHEILRYTESKRVTLCNRVLLLESCGQEESLMHLKWWLSHHPKYWHLIYPPQNTNRVNYYHVLVTLDGVLFSESAIHEEGHSLMLLKTNPNS
jgi:hypothetical protein